MISPPPGYGALGLNVVNRERIFQPNPRWMTQQRLTR